jgi:hypothetical protein
MTLNITLLTRSRIYQSADFRLSDPVTKRVVPKDSTKLVRVQYESFNGFITYTEWEASTPKTPPPFSSIGYPERRT